MSHQVQFNLKISDRIALKNSVEKMGWNYNEAKKSATAWGSSTQKCDAVISIPSERYEIAVLNKGTGATLEMESAVKMKYEGTIRNAYVTEVIQGYAQNNGFAIDYVNDVNGSRVISISRNN